MKIYLVPPINELNIFPLFSRYLSDTPEGSRSFFNSVYREYTYPGFQLVSDVASADFVMLPHNFKIWNAEYQVYIQKYLDLAKAHGKYVVLFACGDLAHDIFVPEAIVFKVAVYRYQKQPNEIIMPHYAQDLSQYAEWYPRHKQEKPIVGFCGWADYPSVKTYIATIVRNIGLSLAAFTSRNSGLLARKKGIYFRKKALEILTSSREVNTNFIMRKTFGAHAKTATKPFELLREEYIRNILESDLCLAVKGDANASVRLWEILSLGRVPIILDTECVFPLEDVVHYKEFSFTVDFRDIKNIGRNTAEFYGTKSDDELLHMQKKAREVFEKFFRVDSFYQYIFSDVDRLKAMAGKK